jgi:mRNA interferase MazF
MARYVPKQGDFVILTFDPQSGHEQKGRRPAFVVSKTEFNRRTGLAFLCPITNTARGFPFHVAVPAGSKLTGYIMVEQTRSLDYKSRKAKFIETAPSDTLDDVLAILDACIYDQNA